MEILENHRLAQYGTFQIGGLADFFVEACSQEEVTGALAWAEERNLPYFIFGAGSNLLFGQYGTSDASYGRGIVNRYPIGTHVRVYYDSDNPSTSVLEPGAGWSSFMVAGIGVLFTLVGFLGSFFQFKKYKRGETVAPPSPASPPVISH